MDLASIAVSWPGARIPEFVRELTSTAVAVIGRSGLLIDANRGFFMLMPESMAAAELLDVRGMFVSPCFERFAAACQDRSAGVVYDGIFNLGSQPGPVSSLRGLMYALHDGIMLVAEHEVAQLELLRTKLLALNDELAAEHRRLASALRALSSERARADEAVRDREALRAQLEAETA